jgi:hypothetical protein
MNFTLNINLDNAAFQDNYNDPAENLAYCMHQVANKIQSLKNQDGTVKDINGNTVGNWEIK